MAAVRRALTSLPWVRQVQVNFYERQAFVTAEEDRYDEKALLKVLEKAGYGGRIVK
ncbi:MAG: heavy-metal-associated domain-containing protein [Planctomycetes bacterium]|nr:heavy-metal-associated domain-containing protein [Planctomycetota bacterium]